MANAVVFEEPELIEMFGTAEGLGLAVVLVRYPNWLTVGLVAASASEQDGPSVKGRTITPIEFFPLYERRRAVAAGRLALKVLQATATALGR